MRPELMIGRALCAFLLAAWAPLALAQPLQPAPDAQPAPAAPSVGSSREGTTFGLSIGLGYGFSSAGLHSGDPAVGPGGINLELGGFFSPTFALVFKSSGVTVWTSNNQGGAIITRGIWAVAAQVWVSDIFKIEAGPGAHYMFGVGSGGAGGDVAPGLYFAPAVQLAEFDGGHSLQAAIEVTNGFYNGGSAHTVGLVLAWQSL
jgi:hypothetical protein